MSTPDEDEEAEKDEEFGVEFHHAAPLSALAELTAAAIAAGSAGRPTRRSTIAPAASRAISATLAHRLRARRGDLALGGGELGGEFVLERPCAWRAASAAAASRAAWARLCAFARASASVFSCAAAAASAFCCIAVASSRSLAIALLRPLDHRPELGQRRAWT